MMETQDFNYSRQTDNDSERGFSILCKIYIDQRQILKSGLSYSIDGNKASLTVKNTAMTLFLNNELLARCKKKSYCSIK